MEHVLDKQEKLVIQECNLFGDRPNLDTAFKDAVSMIDASCKDNSAYAITALMLVWNTLSKKYDIYPKQADSK
tara:strand:+ start:208 stop:426 length:219 start_codon:yes stop_codon:yes gene_type:complete